MNAPAFQLYVQDFLVGSAAMTPDEVGAYIRLLCYQWELGGIPNDLRKIRQLSGLYEEVAIKTVLAKFPAGADGILRNKRLENVRDNQRAYSEKQSQIAKDGWKKRKEQEANESQRNAKPMPTHKKNDGLALPPHMPAMCQNDALQSSSSTSSLSSTASPTSEVESTNKTKRFVRPSVTDVADYCKERGNNVDAQIFIDHYESNGWKVGRTAMKDWKAAVRTWEKNDLNRKPNGTTKNSFHTPAADRLEDAKQRIAESFDFPTQDQNGDAFGESGDIDHFDSVVDVTNG